MTPDASRPTTSADSTGTVLLVDDEEDIREAVRRILAREGYTVLVAPGPQQAVDTVEAHDGPIHLLLTDALMPQMSGRELAGQVRLRRQDICVLYMSGYPRETAVRDGVVDPEAALVEKPFTRDTLLGAVRTALVPSGQI